MIPLLPRLYVRGGSRLVARFSNRFQVVSPQHRNQSVQAAPTSDASGQPTGFQPVNLKYGHHPDESRQKGSSSGLENSRSTESNCVRNQQQSTGHEVTINIDNVDHRFSPIYLRDRCNCERCLDPSTKQKLFSTVEVPANITGEVVAQDSNKVVLKWSNDTPSFDAEHRTTLPLAMLKRRVESGLSFDSVALPLEEYWDNEDFVQSRPDLPFDGYMNDDSVLYAALKKLRTHGLLFLTGVPESGDSVSQIAERIGPLKHTFYGLTWDVRSVPEAKNVAYTSQDLGFHMDLLYMDNPPRLQFLHCVRSSANGGASLFTDSYRAAKELGAEDPDAFADLSGIATTFHYDHPEANLYRQLRFTIDADFPAHVEPRERATWVKSRQINSVAWSPPFQGPFQFEDSPADSQSDREDRLQKFNANMASWHTAAEKFNELIHRPSGIYERLMKPGECVLFDNRRVLHARKAFEVGDQGKERWLRGAYVDGDAFRSKFGVLAHRFPQGNASASHANS